jgi:nucleotide-binding universal stress UspA family protein
VTSHVPQPGRPCPPAPFAVEPEIALRRLLWACDFSPGSAAALRFVIPLARAFESEITALHVIPRSPTPPSSGEPELTNAALLHSHLVHAASTSLDAALRPALSADVPTEVALREGDAVDEILGLAEGLPADLIVLGKRASSAFEWAPPGRVAEGVLGRARCPVLVVPDGVMVTRGLQFKTVLWATDFSAHATQALIHALALAAKSDARLLLLHVTEPGPASTARERTREAQERLAGALAAGRAAGCEVEALVAAGAPAHEVVRVAAERGAELIVMGVQGARSIRRLVFGSTAHRVVRESPCALLAVRKS